MPGPEIIGGDIRRDRRILPHESYIAWLFHAWGFDVMLAFIETLP